MSTHRVRRPKTYPAMLRDTYSILCALRDGGTYKKARTGMFFIFDGYKVQINNTSYEFFRYDKVFLKLHLGALPAEMMVITDTYCFSVQKGIALAEYEMPVSKDEHFNALLMQERFPQWEDMEYLNWIYEIQQELGVEFLKLSSSNFYL